MNPIIVEAQKINRLAPHVAERIAAGETIERPCSVVKELVENSLDAGCTEVRIVLEGGGKNLIEVTDNGSGMDSKDLKLCIERHATSKLKVLEDLEQIFTHGFRGEALPSIAAVSDLSLISKTQASSSAYELQVGDLIHRASSPPEVQKITFGQFIDSSCGTQVHVVGLFSQIPARLKFLKSQSAEVSQVKDWIERLALAHPQVGFQLISDDKTLLNLRPQSELNRVKEVLSDGNDFTILQAHHQKNEFQDLSFQARMYWLQGRSSPHSRNLIQVVNSRAIRDRLLQQALLSAFRQALLPGQFPSLALFIEIHPAAIDVNVHPSKTEIRFLDTKRIFQSVDALVKSLLSQQHLYPSKTISSETQSFENQNTVFFAPPPSLSTTPTHKDPTPSKTQEENQWTPIEAHPISQAHYAGTLFQTYIMLEQESELILIDQHAAHERVRYEKLQNRMNPRGHSPHQPASQTLLMPEVIQFPIENRELLSLRLPWISSLGFDVEIFGEDTLIFRSVPAEWGTQQLKIRLSNLLDRILSAEDSRMSMKTPEPIETESIKPESIKIDELLFEALASEACHSAIRAGDPLEKEEVQSLIHQLFTCEHPWNCPHGRPTVVKIPKGKLEQWFQRKIESRSPLEF